MSDVMDQPWCCLTCNAKFRFGQLVTVPGANQFGVGCPTCKSGNIHPADGEVGQLDEYLGEKGTIQ